MAEQKKKVSETLEHTYPPEEKVEPAQNTEQLEKLSKELDEVKSKLEETEKENAELKDKLAAVEQEKLKALAEQVAELKVTKGLLTQEGKEKEVEKLSGMSTETLTVLREELSAVQVKLSEDPAATPPEDPEEPSEEDEKEEQLKQMRMKMFGHEEDPVEFYTKEREAGRL